MSHNTSPSPDSLLLAERIVTMPRLVVAALLRVGRRIGEGFEGEIIISVRRGGIAFIRWTQTETGESIKEELS